MVTVRQQSLKLLDKMFDLVAPITIYHRADILFKEKAQKARQSIKRGKSLYNGMTGLPDDNKLDNLDEWAKENYDLLFEEIVADTTEGWKWDYDGYGSKRFKDEHGTIVFSGDGPYEFPLYETAKLLRERIQKHIEDQDEYNDEL